MFFRRNTILLLALLAFGCGGARTFAAGADERAFTAASLSFQNGFWERAEGEFGAFAQKFPKSLHWAEAVLYQAEARYNLKRYDAAAELLAANQTRSGGLADEYLFWTAQAQLQSGGAAAAAKIFAELVRDFPDSTRRLEACVGEATAFARLHEWPRVAELLRQADGPFQQAAKSSATNENLVNGFLLLGEAQLRQQDFEGVKAALQWLAAQKLNAEADWRRWHLQCRLELALNNPADALRSTTNLITLADAVNRPEWQAESAALRAEILERSQHYDEAIAAFQKNLGTNMPVEQQRTALLKIAELSREQNRTTNAIATLETYLQQHPAAPAADMALLALGEMELKQFTAADAGDTNLLAGALSRFDELLNTFPDSALRGKAFLDKGWCLWASSNYPPSRAAFQLAAEKLPPSGDAAVARFKWADAQFMLGDFAGAITNYNFVVDQFSSLPEVKANLVEPALYQVFRSAMEAGRFDDATNALEKILGEYPEGFAAPHCLLLAGQGLARQTSDPAGARVWLARFEERYPTNALLPQVRLAIARSYEQERNWDAATTNYDGWIADFTNQPQRAVAEFSRAWDNYMAGHETNAFEQFTNFIARFPADDLAPRAQWWIGDYYFRQGDFSSAEANYQLVFNNTQWQNSGLTYPAQMAAGRAAMARLGYKDAIGYFTNLTSDPKCPPDLYAQAVFAYGDAMMNRATEETNRAADLNEAIRIFGKIAPTNDLAPAALGRVGDCYLQLAAATNVFLDLASNTFQQVVSLPLANVAVRSQAKVGLGIVAEKQAQFKTGEEQARLLNLALNDYLDVLFRKDLRDGEQPDPFWTKKAGLEAARLAEAMQDWPHALKIYEELQKLLPPLSAPLEKKILRVREHLPSE